LFKGYQKLLKMSESPIDNEFLQKFKDDKLLKDLQNLILGANNGKKVRMSFIPVPSPSAQNNELYRSRIVDNLAVNFHKLLSRENTELSRVDKAVMELQLLYGLRISEVLGIKSADIGINGDIRVKGLKGSNNRVVYSVIYKEFWQGMREFGYNIPSFYNRFHFHRLYKKKGIYQVFGNNKNTSVTHSLRYNYIITLLEKGLTELEIKNVIGHKVVNNTINYINNVKTK
jgi:integrase